MKLDPYYENKKKWRLKNPNAKKDWYKTNRDKVRDLSLRTKYGVTLEEYNLMLDKQGGCCKICLKHHSELKKALSVDHNHETKLIRALLCTRCNILLGQCKESIAVLYNAIDYLVNYEIKC